MISTSWTKNRNTQNGTQVRPLCVRDNKNSKQLAHLRQCNYESDHRLMITTPDFVHVGLVQKSEPRGLKNDSSADPKQHSFGLRRLWDGLFT